MSKQSKKRMSQSGFTLVELSIVLVIIGLIISSVLVGQDLVRSAELRASITQYEGFNSAVATFRGKYSGLPGDVAGATNFGFTGNGNNNGLLLAVATGGATTFAAGENVYFWNHLGSTGAALVSGTYNGAAVVSSSISSTLPAAKAGNYWGVYAGNATATAEVTSSTVEAGQNFYILGVTGGTSGQTNAASATPTLIPLEAQSIDSKIDDGKPSTGIVRARGSATADAADQAPTSAASGTATCTLYVATSYVTAPVTNTYATTATTPLCNLRFKMPF